LVLTQSFSHLNALRNFPNLAKKISTPRRRQTTYQNLPSLNTNSPPSPLLRLHFFPLAGYTEHMQFFALRGWRANLSPLNALNVNARQTQQSGQVGLIIILIMVVLLTIAQQEDESTRVFNAAEAGIEQALATDLNFQGEELHPGPTNIPGSNATVEYAIQKQRTLEARLFEGVSARVQLKDSGNPTPPASIKIEWSKEKDCSSQDPASLLVSVYSVDTSYNPTYTTVRHFAYSACDHGDSIALAADAADATYKKEVTIPLTATDDFIRIKPVYNDSYVRVTPIGGTLPVQYYNIRSSAKNQSGNEERIVEVQRTIPVAPSVLDYVLFSGTTLVK
jgi:hypothetical protein